MELFAQCYVAAWIRGLWRRIDTYIWMDESLYCPPKTIKTLLISYEKEKGENVNPSVHFSSVQLLSHVQLCNSMNRSMPGHPVHHQLLEFTQTHVHQVGDAIQTSHPLSSPSPPAPNPSEHQGLFQRVNSSHEAAKVLEFQL